VDNAFKFDVFISYRRDGGEVIGRLLFELLKNEYNVFFDHESLSSGRFDTKLLDIISQANDVVVVLSPGCFDRCVNEGDWFMQEISCALEHRKNVILLMTEDFVIPTKEELTKYPEAIRTLVMYNGYVMNVAYIDSVIAKLKNDLVTRKREYSSAVENISQWHEFSTKIADKDYVALLPEELKMKILRGAITSFLDENNAKIFTSILDRMSGRVYNIRTKFRYEIQINERFSFRGVDIDEDKYYELSETFAYTKKFLKGEPDKQFWLSFATNLDELDSALRDENFFFSENLLIEREDMKLLVSLDEDEKKKFYVSAMKVKINVNGKELLPDKIIIDESGVFARYELTEEIMANSEILDVKIRFRIPQKMGDGYFFASISEPTYSPFIRFDYPEDVFDVTMIPFLNRSVTAKETKIFDGQRELSVDGEWVLPVSGVIFLINRLGE